MNKPIVIALLIASAAQAQMVSLIPTSYTQSVLSQNNEGKWWGLWKDDALDEISLDSRRLVVTHTTYFNSVYYMGSYMGSPRMIQERYVYRQIGGATYVPAGGQSVVYFAPKKAGGWIAATNFISDTDMQPFFWLPCMVGTVTLGDKVRRTVTSASPLSCTGRNLAGSTPYLVKFKCIGAGIPFDYLFRFEPNETKSISLSTAHANTDFMVFDMDDVTDEPLSW